MKQISRKLEREISVLSPVGQFIIHFVVCFSNFGIGHRVRNNVTNHIGGSMHKKHVAAIKNQKLSD